MSVNIKCKPVVTFFLYYGGRTIVWYKRVLDIIITVRYELMPTE